MTRLAVLAVGSAVGVFAAQAVTRWIAAEKAYRTVAQLAAGYRCTCDRR